MYFEEDLIPIFDCVQCERRFCKDEIGRRIGDGLKCVCIYCHYKGEV